VAGTVVDSGRGAILVGNKWDLVPEREAAYKALKKEADARLRFSRWSPFVTISALEGQRVDAVFDLIDRVHAAGDVTIPTPRLNRFLTDFRVGYDTAGRGPKLRYLTQVGVRPPTFLRVRTRGGPSAFLGGPPAGESSSGGFRDRSDPHSHSLQEGRGPGGPRGRAKSRPGVRKQRT
jgi:hypothetical protein